MGRPIKKSYFANLNSPYQNQATGGLTGQGGEGVVIDVTNSGTNYSQGISMTVGSPNLAGGRQATISYSVNSAGSVAVTVTDAGTGYVSAPTVTLTQPPVVNTFGTATNASYTLTNVVSVSGIYVGMQADGTWGMQSGAFVQSVGTNTVTLTKTMTASTASVSLTFTDVGASFAKTVTLTSVVPNAIATSAWIPGGSSAKIADIMKQESSRRYLVDTADGKGICKLVTDTPAEGQMTITATDSDNNTYYVKKLTAHRAVLIQNSGSGFQFANNSAAGWNLTAAVANVSVKLSSN